jgi:hypothetical protein
MGRRRPSSADGLAWGLQGCASNGAWRRSKAGLRSKKFEGLSSKNVGFPGRFELYDPATGLWSDAGSNNVQLAGFNEIGPQVLRPDGTVFVVGATGHTGICDTKTGRWSAGPDFPVGADGQLDVADGAGAMLPNGNVLVAASPGLFQPGTRFFEFDGRGLTEVAAPPDAAASSSFVFYALIPPTGEILVNNSNDSAGAMVYSAGKGGRSDWAPEVESAPATLRADTSYRVSGKRFNGLSQGAAYGDDVQSASNCPLVRITNRDTGHVAYARTHKHSSMAFGKQTRGSALFDMPVGVESGAITLEVVANGIASAPVRVTVMR